MFSSAAKFDLLLLVVVRHLFMLVQALPLPLLIIKY
jgi:hypothetical protein